MFLVDNKMSSRSVKLHVYDLSNGLARSLSMSLLGKQIDGIWHTGIVVNDTEYFFGQGIQHCPVDQSPFGTPLQVIDLGTTDIDDALLRDFLQDIQPRFNAQTYDLLSNNCNNFSEEVAQFLVGKSIPAHITGLPAEVAATPFGRMILPMLQPAMQQRLSSATSVGFAQDSSAVSSTLANAVDTATHTHTATDMLSSTQSARTSAASTSKPCDTAAAAAARHLGSKSDAKAAEAAKAAFKDALHQEFANVRAEGVADANKAGSEALRRVMVAVKDGLVQGPNGASAA